MRCIPAASLLLLLLPAARGQTAAGEAGAARKLALIVGINRYQRQQDDRGWQDLTGCVNDALRARDLLVKRFGFPPGNILVLTDEHATHRGIVTAFHEWLIQRAGPETEVVFWYSGHGSRVPDASGRPGLESDGMDSTFVTHDSRKQGRDGSFDLTDDELHSLLRALCARTQRVTVVTDSCHSGGVTRGPAGLPVRSVTPGRRPVGRPQIASFWPEDVPFLEDGDPARTAPLPYVHIAACAAEEEAREKTLQIGDGEVVSYGLLSFELSEAMRDMPPGTTYQQLVEEVARRIADESPAQQVHLEGDGSRVVFEGRFSEPLPGFPAEFRPRRKYLEVEAGAMHLLREGTILEIQRLDGRVLGRAVVRTLKPVSCFAEWQDGRPELDEPLALRAVEVARPAGAAPLVLFVAEGTEGDRLATAIAAWEQPAVRVVRDEASGAQCQLFIPPGRKGWEIWTVPDGLVLHREAPAGAGERWPVLLDALRSKLTRELRFREIQKLGGIASSVPVQASFRTPQDLQLLAEPEYQTARMSRSSTRGLAAAAQGALVLEDAGGRKVHDLVELQVTLGGRPGGRDLYLAVLCLSEDRRIWGIYPRAGARDNHFPPGSTVPITFEIFANEGWTEDRPMRDRYLVIATDRYADFSSYLRSDGALEGPRPAAATRGSGPPLPALLADAFGDGATRGGGLLDTREPRFGLAAVDIYVKPLPEG